MGVVLMTTREAVALALGLVAAAVALFLGRYSVTPAPAHDSTIVYRLDRWTGEVTAINHQGTKRLKEINPP